MKKLAILYFLIFVVALLVITNYNSILFEFSDLFLLPNLVLAIVFTIGLASLHFFILKKKPYCLYLFLFASTFLIFSVIYGVSSIDLIMIIYFAGIALLLLLLIYIPYSMTPSGSKSLEESIERSLGGLPFLYLSGLDSVEEDSMVLIVIVANQLVIKKDRTTVLRTIELSEIKSIKPLSENTITEKEKSVIARALAGGLIFGVVGAIVGGMSGIGTKKEVKTEHFIKIVLNDGAEFLLAPCMNNPENARYLTDKFEEYLKK